MGIFRRRHKALEQKKRPLSAYAEAESNPELIAAEAEVNAEPFVTEVINPIEDERLDPY